MTPMYYQNKLSVIKIFNNCFISKADVMAKYKITTNFLHYLHLNIFHISSLERFSDLKKNKLLLQVLKRDRQDPTLLHTMPSSFAG